MSLNINYSYSFKKNQSMLEDERMKESQRVLKKFRVNFLEACEGTLGHVYSVYVEQTKIKNPDINNLTSPHSSR